MSQYPTVIDSAATLFTPVDASSVKTLETALVAGINDSATSLPVLSTLAGFAAVQGVVSIDDEIIAYASKTATSFDDCTRGAFGSVRSTHAEDALVRALMVSGFITALQDAVLAIENELGTAAARNYVQKAGAVTITGLKTFADGIGVGNGTLASTGFVRLPNAGALRWKKAGAGDAGFYLSASDHIVAEAIVDFAANQPLPPGNIQVATYAACGIVQIVTGGGLQVQSGNLSIADSAVTPGSYAKVTVNQKGVVTAGAALAAIDLPSHQHPASDISLGVMPVARGGTGLGSVTIGDLLYASAPNTLASLAGNVVAAKRFLTQTGTGAGSAAPAWSSIAAGDLPSHGHTATDIVSGTLDNARTSGTASATASTLVLRDGSGGASFGYVAANNQWAYLDSHFQSLESGAYQTVGGAFENMAKYAEDFTAATWDKNGGSCSATSNAVAAPDGNSTADSITASTATPVIKQQVAGLTSGGQYTFYVWAKVASGTKQVSVTIVDNAYAGYLAGPTSITLTTAWQRFKITGTLAGGQTGLWIVVRQFAGNGDNWTSGAIYLWGACLQQGNDPKSGYARTWASQTAFVAAGVACGATVVAAKDTAESPLRIYGPGSNLADHRLLEVTCTGELIIAGGTGNGYRLAELMGATNPSGWSGVLKVKTPAGATAGYILLYSNP